MNNTSDKNKLLVVHSSKDDDPANFRVNFHEPIVFPEQAQVRLINCRVNLDDNEVIINEDNKAILWGLGWQHLSEYNRNRNGFQLAYIEEGTYLNTVGAGAQHITTAVKNALNNSCLGRNAYLRGGFTVGITGGKLTVKLSKCVVPTIVNASTTGSKWEPQNLISQPDENGIRFSSRSIITDPSTIINSVNDLTGAGGYNGCRFRLTNQSGESEDFSAFVSDEVIVGLSNADGANPSYLAQFDLSKVNTGAPTVPRMKAEWGLTNKNVAIDVNEYFVGKTNVPNGFSALRKIVNVRTSGGEVNGLISFRYNHTKKTLKILEKKLQLRIGEGWSIKGNVIENVLRTVQCGTIMDKILQFRVSFLEPTGHPVDVSNMPRYKYRVQVDITDGTVLPGAGGNYDETRDVLNNWYSDTPNKQNILRRPEHNDCNSPWCAFIATRGELADDPDAFFTTCAFDTKVNYTSRDIDPPHYPLLLLGNTLSDAVIRDIENTYGAGDFSQELYARSFSYVGPGLGFTNDALVLGTEGTAFTNGVEAPSLILTSRSDQACYYLQMEDLPIMNYTGVKNGGKPNKIVGLITLKTRADDLYYPSENKTAVYVDLHNTSPLQYNNLGFRICDKEGRDVRDIYNYTILTLEVRQNPNVALKKMFKQLSMDLTTNVRADYKAGQTQLDINKLGQ